MDIEFRAVKKDDESFEIQYRYELNEWLKLEYFNEKVVNVIVDALNNHAKNTKIS